RSSRLRSERPTNGAPPASIAIPKASVAAGQSCSPTSKSATSQCPLPPCIETVWSRTHEIKFSFVLAEISAAYCLTERKTPNRLNALLQGVATETVRAVAVVRHAVEGSRMTSDAQQEGRSIGRRAALNMLLAAVSVLVSTGRSVAQSWPHKPIRAVSPITAGSAADVIARSVFEQMSARLGQPIVMENRPGAEGTIGMSAVARAEPDGYTILSHSAALTVVAATHKGLPYDTVRDFAPITPMAKIPSVLVISPSKNIRSIRDLISA